MSAPTKEEVEAVLARTAPIDPTIAAVIVFVEAMCDCATREATGFHTASTLNAARDYARGYFIAAMERAEVAAQQSEG